ncbi:HAD-IA family hydrolase [Conexibacter sp. W3-3-2]|uniref:HAD family phosphatase n=1 Tax=Paraconexibacter algicola TaxID=2133960 RepID=A0A2T4UHH4_9ACTN|nr:HAD-IA family hydrolase [Conexibacter sp. W3-3-2]PTL58659.1 HAD family phosphatase [Paraconexibacter algicola]
MCVVTATPPDAVVFDNDGLLLDTEVAWTRAEVTLFARRDRTFTDEHKRYIIGSSRAVAARKLEEMLDRPGEGIALMDELHDLVMEELLGGCPPRPGALELLDALEAAGRPFALASNSSRPFCERALTVGGVRDRFAIVLTADDVEHPKPAPDLYLAAAAALGVPAERCAGLEDSPPGVAAAHAAGMFVIGVPYLPGTELPHADLLAGSLADDAVHAALGLR